MTGALATRACVALEPGVVPDDVTLVGWEAERCALERAVPRAAAEVARLVQEGGRVTRPSL